jgi:TatD DNase family protein
MTNMLIDTHAHLDFPDFAKDLMDLLRRAEQADVKRIIAIGTSIESSRRAIELAEKHPAVYAAIGVHGDWRDRVRLSSFAE